MFGRTVLTNREDFSYLELLLISILMVVVLDGSLEHVALRMKRNKQFGLFNADDYSKEVNLS